MGKQIQVFREIKGWGKAGLGWFYKEIWIDIVAYEESKIKWSWGSWGIIKWNSINYWKEALKWIVRSHRDTWQSFLRALRAYKESRAWN